LKRRDQSEGLRNQDEMLNAGRRRQRGGGAARGNVVDPRFIGRKRNHKVEEWQTLFLVFAFLVLLVALCGLILWQQPASIPPVEEAGEPKQRVAESSVQERGLVTRNVTWESIVAVRALYCRFFL
jgi:hypothetical protein